MRMADEIKVAVVAAVCVIALAIVFKQVLHTRPYFLVSYAPSLVFIAYLLTRRPRRPVSKWNGALGWSLATVAVTLLMVVVSVI